MDILLLQELLAGKARGYEYWGMERREALDRAAGELACAAEGYLSGRHLFSFRCRIEGARRLLLRQAAQVLPCRDAAGFPTDRCAA